MQELNSAQNAAVGMICGSIEVCIDQPMLYWKNAAQQHLPFTINPKLLYRGLLASIVNMGGATAIQYFATGLAKQALIGNEDRSQTISEFLIPAFVGGAISGIVCCPLELTMIQQQRFGGNIIGTPKNIINEVGILGMCRGMLPSITREGIYTCGCLGLTPLLQCKISNNDRFNALPRPLTQFGCSMIAGFIASGLSHPADTIKTCMQGDIQQNTYTRAIGGSLLIINRDGIYGLYKGFFWKYLRVGMAYFILNLTMHPVSNGLYPQAFNKKSTSKHQPAFLFQNQ